MRRVSKRLSSFAAPAAVLGLLAGCAGAGLFGYAPPAPNAPLQDRRVVDAGYDETWNGLIDYAASTFFTIDNFEKDSGLMTLGFGDGNMARFVDCGTWTEDTGGTTPYAARTNQGLELRARMNLRVRSLSESQTEIRVSSRYVVRNKSGHVWDFTTNNPATVDISSTSALGTQPTRTCQSSLAAEKEILNGVEALARR